MSTVFCSVRVDRRKSSQEGKDETFPFLRDGVPKFSAVLSDIKGYRRNGDLLQTRREWCDKRGLYEWVYVCYNNGARWTALLPNA